MASHDHRSRLATQGGIYTAPPDGFGPPRTGRVLTVKVECPDCHAPAGERCRNLTTGEPAKTTHRARKRMAARAGLVAAPAPVSRPVRLPAGRPVVTCPVCGCDITETQARYSTTDARRGDLILSSHRVGGGRVSMKHQGDVECRGSGRPLKVLLAEATPTD